MHIKEPRPKGSLLCSQPRFLSRIISNVHPLLYIYPALDFACASPTHWQLAVLLLDRARGGV
jgi:hypothetical protein